jgi:hypothetical protein
VTPEHPANYAKSLRQIEDAAELLTRLAVALPLRWQHLVDAQPGQPGAASYDGDQGGTTSVVVCDRHQCDINACHQRGDVGCSGHPIPKRTDPTGQAGSGSDRAALDIREFRKACRTVALLSERMVRILAEYEPRPANAYERQITRNNDPGCASCARLPGVNGEPRWEPIEQGVRINGEIVKVCSWCRSWVKGHGYAGLPPRDVVERHHREGDRRVKRGA